MSGHRLLRHGTSGGQTLRAGAALFAAPLAALLSVPALIGGCTAEECPGGPSVDDLPAGPDEAIEITCPSNPLVGEPPPPYDVSLGGTTYTLRDGFAWVPDGCGWKKAEGQPDTGYYAPPYGADFASAYSVDGCDISRVADDGSLVPVGKQFEAMFDAVEGPLACDLLGPTYGFTTFTLQSPASPDIPDYIARRDCLCLGDCDFADNRLEVLAEAAHDGTRGIRATAVPPSEAMTAVGFTSKASIETPLVHYVRGDEVTIRAWIRVQEGGGVPYGLIDLESTWIDGAAGPRLLIEGGALEVELKFADRPRFWQPDPVPFPIGAWVDVQITYLLQPDDTGRVQVWQNGIQVIDAAGQTLPLPNTILSSLEIGITAHDGEGGTAVLDVDSVTTTGKR
jgi:hypothetical protein